MKFLLPIDGSEASSNTLRWAVNFLNPDTAQILLLNIYHCSPEGGYRYPSEEESLKILKDARTLFENNHFRVRSAETILGGTADTICDYAWTHGVDQIVMGARGSGMSRMVMGSTSRQVMQCAKQPVMVVENRKSDPLTLTRPHQAELAELSEESHQPIKTLLPVDGSEASWETLKWAADFLTPAQAFIHLLFVIPRHASADSPEAEEARAILEEAGRFFERQGFRVQCEQTANDPARGICRYADTHDIDQIIIGTRGKSPVLNALVGSVSSRVVSQAHQPVLLLRNMDVSRLEVSRSDQLPLTLTSE